MTGFRRPKGIAPTAHVIISTYECPCGEIWDDVWDSGCDDECGVCGTTVSPVQMEDHPGCDCLDCEGMKDGDELILHSSRGWSLDRDGWWSRPIVRRDVFTAAVAEHTANRVTFSVKYNEQVMRSERGCIIGDSNCTFTMNGRLYCRNAKQKRRLDVGLPI